MTTAPLARFKDLGDLLYDPTMDHRQIIREQYNEYGALDIFSPDDVLLDVGGCIGATVAYALVHHAARHVTSIEPHPGNFSLLKRNFGKHPQVALLNAAVVADTYQGKHVGLAISKNDKRSSTHSTVLFRGRDKTVPVRAIRISDALALQPFTIVKVDIEGGEYDLLAGPEPVVFPDSVHRLIVELHLSRSHWRLDRAPIVAKRIEEQGFKLVDNARPWTGTEWYHVMGWRR